MAAVFKLLKCSLAIMQECIQYCKYPNLTAGTFSHMLATPQAIPIDVDVHAVHVPGSMSFNGNVARAHLVLHELAVQKDHPLGQNGLTHSIDVALASQIGRPPQETF